MENSENDTMPNLVKKPIWKNKVVLTVAIIVLLIGGWLLIRRFAFDYYYLIGGSMEPTLHQGELVWASKINLGYKRGDVIIFTEPSSDSTGLILFKRIIGIPGDKVSIENGSVYVNNKIIEEDYINKLSTVGKQITSLKDDEYFVLGDNREVNASYDSRSWGPLNTRLIIGKVIMPR